MEEYYSDQKENNRDNDELLTELDMAAAQQLMQLSDEENHSNRENIIDDDEEVDQGLMKIINYGVPNLITSGSRLRTAWEKIEEIFGKEEEEEEEEGEGEIICDRPRKKQKRRSLASIYRRTKPIDEDDYKTSIHEKKTVKKSS